MTGRLIVLRDREVTHQSHAEFFNLQEHPKGVYLVNVRQGDHSWHRRVVVE